MEPSCKMVYMGGKERLADQIAAELTQLRGRGQLYWEPFLGSAAVFERMAGPKLGSDAMTSLIMLWNELIQGKFQEPGVITRDEYYRLIRGSEHSALRAFAGFFWSFNGCFNKGYAPEVFARSRSWAGMLRRAEVFRKYSEGFRIVACSYDVPQLNNVLIYADPPYKDTEPYQGVPEFDHEKFYDWCRAQRLRGNTVVVSEYQMPEDFQVLKQFPISLNFISHDTNDRIETLFYLP